MMRESNQSIQKFVTEARSGNRAGMGRLAVAVRERLYPFVLRTTWDPDLTEDILQETLLAMVRQVGSLRQTTKFWPWVYRIAWSKVQNNLRSARLHSAAKASLLCNLSRDGNGGSGSILEVTIHAEKLQRLSALIEQLSRQHKDVLHAPGSTARPEALKLNCYKKIRTFLVSSSSRTAQRGMERPGRAR
ncbi:MAG: RNA polymerase sigma factor [Planctomycetota bacterium]|jgi:DNA-directed RNA polymerase specialized sigma24 family protein